jgi:hypothetical protein
MYDGNDPVTIAWLKSIPRVYVLTVTPSLASKEELDDWAEYIKVNGDPSSDEWKNRPGNYELMVKQGEHLKTAINES